MDQISEDNENGERKSEAHPKISGVNDMEQIPEVDHADNAKEENMWCNLHGNYNHTYGH